MWLITSQNTLQNVYLSQIIQERLKYLTYCLLASSKRRLNASDTRSLQISSQILFAHSRDSKFVQIWKGNLLHERPFRDRSSECFSHDWEVGNVKFVQWLTEQEAHMIMSKHDWRGKLWNSIQHGHNIVRKVRSPWRSSWRMIKRQIGLGLFSCKKRRKWQNKGVMMS